LLRSHAGFRWLDRILLTHGHFDHGLGIPGLLSTPVAAKMTIHASASTLDVVVRMLAGLWGEGRVPIPLELFPLTTCEITTCEAEPPDCVGSDQLLIIAPTGG
jgi:ribonuclease Z